MKNIDLTIKLFLLISIYSLSLPCFSLLGFMKKERKWYQESVEKTFQLDALVSFYLSVHCYNPQTVFSSGIDFNSSNNSFCFYFVYNLTASMAIPMELVKVGRKRLPKRLFDVLVYSGFAFCSSNR